jgi:hypothetical protein
LEEQTPGEIVVLGEEEWLFWQHKGAVEEVEWILNFVLQLFVVISSIELLI